MTAQIRKWYYLVAALAASVVPILVTLGVVSDNQGNAWINAILAIGSVLGVAAPVTAGVVLHNQIKNAPADKVVTSLQEIQAQVDTTAAAARGQLDAGVQAVVDSINKIQATVGNVVGPQVSLGPLAAQVIKSVTE